MRTYVVRMNGMKVRSFTGVSLLVVSTWAKKHCKGKVEIKELSECKELPHASSRIYPNLDSAPLTYKPFISLTY